MSDEVVFGDSSPDDAFDALDAEQVIDLDQLVALQQMYDAVEAIEDDDERLRAAIALTARLEG